MYGAMETALLLPYYDVSTKIVGPLYREGRKTPNFFPLFEPKVHHPIQFPPSEYVLPRVHDGITLVSASNSVI